MFLFCSECLDIKFALFLNKVASNYKSTVPGIEREILFIFTMMCLLLWLSSECHSMRARTWFFVSAISPGPREGLAGSGCSILRKRTNEWMTQSLMPTDPALPLHTLSEQSTGQGTAQDKNTFPSQRLLC